MVHSLPAIVNIEHFRGMKLFETVPVLYCVNTQNITVMSSFVPAVMKKVGRHWEILDKNVANPNFFFHKSTFL